MFVPLVGVHKNPSINYVARRIIGSLDYVCSTEDNLKYQREIKEQQELADDSTNLATLTHTKRYVKRPEASSSKDRKDFHDLISPHLLSIRDYLVETYKKINDLDIEHDIRTVVSEVIVENERELKAIEDLFYVLAGEAALEDDIYSALMPQYEEVPGYNPIGLLYLISDQIRLSREEYAKFCGVYKKDACDWLE